MRKLLIFSLLTIILSSCGGSKFDPIISKSPDDNVILTVTGHKETSFSPIMVSLNVKYLKFDDNLNFEVMNSKLDKETCVFDWIGPGECTVTVAHSDGERVKVYVHAWEGKLSVKKV